MDKVKKKVLKMVSIRLPSDLHLSSKKRALEEGRSLQELIAEILTEYLKMCNKID